MLGSQSTDCSDEVKITVRVVPGSRRTEFVGLHDGQYKIRISAPPEKGKANKTLVDFLASQFKIKKNNVQIQSGRTSRIKQVLLRGVSSQNVQRFLSNPS